MSSFWVKMLLFGAVIAGLVITIKFFSKSELSPPPDQPSFYDTVRKDQERLRTEPEFVEPLKAEPEPIVEQPKPAAQKVVAVEHETAEVSKPQFKELSEIEDIEAQRLFEFALNQRSMGRLPVVGYKPMVDVCRDIIARFPGSAYEFKAKRMLGDIPERFWRRYKITKEEVDLGNLK